MRGRVRHDEHGIPCVSGGSVLDVAWAQGHDVATDRTWQIELERLRGEGRVAELVGPAGLPWDVFARRALIEDTARRIHGRLDPDTRAFVDAFVDGVNHGLAAAPRPVELEALGARAGQWRPWTPLAVFWVQQILFSSFPTKLWHGWAGRRLDPSVMDVLRRGEEEVEILPGPGSNAWAVSGARTASGLPMIGGDPHRLLESPGPYQQVRLTCTDPEDAFDVVGFTFAGVPGVQHFAHAGDVAWGITNAMADYQDVFRERLVRTDEGVLAEGPDGWYDADVGDDVVHVRGGRSEHVPIVVTLQGPVVVGGPDDDEAFSLRLPAYVARDLGFGALLPLLRARTVDDVDAALDHWVEPVNSVLAADRSGAVRWRVAGRVPDRSARNRHAPAPAWDVDHAWRGWRELPRADVGAAGRIVTANQRTSPVPGADEPDPLGLDYAPPHRADRVHRLLEDRWDLDVEDFARLHVDTHLAQGERLVKTVQEVDGLEPGAAAVRDALAAWDLSMDAGSVGAGRYAAVRDALVRRIVADPAFAPLHDPHPYGQVFDPWFSVPTRVAGALDELLASPPASVDVVGHLRAALDDVAGQPALPWGDTHRLHALHGLDVLGVLDDHPGLAEAVAVPDVALSGDHDCVLATSAAPGLTDRCVRGPVARYVWDLGDRDHSRWIVPFGASGRHDDPHRLDQLGRWASGRLVRTPVPQEDPP